MEGRNKPATCSLAAVYPHDAARSRPISHVVGILTTVAGIGFLVLVMIFLFMLDRNTPKLPELRVDSFSVSNLTYTNGSAVSFLAEVRLTARNPSGKVSIPYNHIVAGIYYKMMLLSQCTVAPFSQEAKNKTSLVAKLAAHGNAVEKWVGYGITGDIEENGRVEFDFKLASWINWDYNLWWWTGRIVLKVFCGDLTVAIPSNGSSGSLINPPGYCWVRQGADDDDIRFLNNFT